jgi:hypothetical protein
VLDVAFCEDDSRVRTGFAVANFAVLRHLELNLLRREATARLGIKAKRLKAGWDETHLLAVLAVCYAIALSRCRPLTGNGPSSRIMETSESAAAAVDCRAGVPSRG